MISRKALCVGIDYYEKGKKLTGCVNDALKVSEVLKTNGDGSINFSVENILISEEKNVFNSNDLKRSIKKLFEGEEEIALFYFSGHGKIEEGNSMLCCSDGSSISLTYIIGVASESKIKNKVIILDSCFAGGIGDIGIINNSSLIPDGVTILTACSKNQTAVERDSCGVFTKLFIEAMQGGYANLLGGITLASVYSYIETALSPWEQTPIFKTNVNNFVVLRKIKVPVTPEDLHNLVDLFEKEDDHFKLNPTFEPKSENSVKENTIIFELLQKFNKLDVVKPVGEEHMYYAAINSKSCKLTEKGKLYWKLVKKERI